MWMLLWRMEWRKNAWYFFLPMFLCFLNCYIWWCILLLCCSWFWKCSFIWSYLMFAFASWYLSFLATYTIFFGDNAVCDLSLALEHRNFWSRVEHHKLFFLLTWHQRFVLLSTSHDVGLVLWCWMWPTHLYQHHTHVFFVNINV